LGKCFINRKTEIAVLNRMLLSGDLCFIDFNPYFQAIFRSSKDLIQQEQALLTPSIIKSLLPQVSAWYVSTIAACYSSLHMKLRPYNDKQHAI
jgi:hypothetical protein